mmetsp:Transcript_24689/g.58602  ORF Transcript_24689/g.58602 Transcript_24689/m.58602 type:complete len:99 (-) Transcript_24689:79-375(-)
MSENVHRLILLLDSTVVTAAASVDEDNTPPNQAPETSFLLRFGTRDQTVYHGQDSVYAGPGLLPLQGVPPTALSPSPTPRSGQMQKDQPTTGGKETEQ